MIDPRELRLWFWKWFRPSKYIHHLAEELEAAYPADAEEVDP
jgi:hypothetical protein